MSEHSTPEQRTEMPTDKRMGELRKNGQLFISFETVQVITLLMGVTVLGRVLPLLTTSMKHIFEIAFHTIANKEPVSAGTAVRGLTGLVILVGPAMLLLIGSIATAAVLAVMLQTRWNVKEKKIKFEWPMLNPIGGIKKIFSLNGLVNTFKSIFKLILILPLGYIALKNLAPLIVMLPFYSLHDLFTFVQKGISEIFWKIFYVFAAIAVFDYVYGKWKWLRDVKMTKEEVKDERKSLEGDETTRRKIIAKGLQRAASRIAKSVPKADVIITNPTHYAVALKYDRKTMRAPQVLAKGQDYMALRIRAIATEHNIPIVERKPLARALYDGTKVGTEVPFELYRAVAEVLAYVYKLKRKMSKRAQ